MNKYLEQFLSLNCSGDVLNACLPINNPSKEITEAMAMIRQIKPIVLANKMRFALIDLCAGNALTSIIAVHLLPIKGALAIDLKPVQRPHRENVKRFVYLKGDIYAKEMPSFLTLLHSADQTDLIITSTHPCGNLAHRIIELYKSVESAKHLILMPCCKGNYLGKYPELFQKKLGKYLLWSWDLAQQADGTLIQDEHVLSPCNAVVTAHKE